MTQSKHTMTAIITLFPGSNFLKEKSEKGRDIPTSSASKWQSWAWHLQPMALLVVFLPPYFTGRCLAPGRGGGAAQGSLPKTSDSYSDPQWATPPVPPWPRPSTLRRLQSQGHFQTNEKPGHARVMEHGGLSHEVQTQQRNQSPGRGHSAHTGPPNPLHHRQTQPPSGSLTLRLLSW